jgi:sigma-B regulation protein RsbU (phosphoserine phosphatase)
MNTLQFDCINISTGLLACAAGLLAFVISLFRLKSRDLTLFNFGIFGFFYGLQRLVKTSIITIVFGSQFTFPYLHGLLTYAFVIPLSAFMVDIYGHGFYNSMLWVYRSTIIYAVVALPYDLFLRTRPLTDVAIYRPIVIIWAVVWIVNVLFSKRRRDVELQILRVVFLIYLILMLIDQLMSMRVLSLGINIEKPGFAVLIIGLGIVAVHHFLVNERKLHSIEQEIEIARRIQESNLPASIRLPKEIDIASRYVPMSTVAGDFYDVQIKDDKGIGILIADVSGHGVGAALFGSMLKICFASQVLHIDDPAYVLTEINRVLQGKIETSFITACSLFIDFKSEILRYSIAGHPPPFLQRKSNQEIIRLTHAGTILGPFPNIVYENEELNLEKGDRLVLYTDGIIETKNKNGEFFGDNHLEALIKTHTHDSPESIANKTIEQVIKWSGRSVTKSLDDDLTLIVADVLV